MWQQQTTQPLTYTGGIKFTSLLTDPPVAGGRRSEYQDQYTQPMGAERTYGWWLKIPADWEQEDFWVVISQFHHALGVIASPPFAIEIQDGNLVVRIRNDGDSSGVVYAQPALFGEWLYFEINVLWAVDGTGWTKLQMNGVEIVDYTGANYYSGTDNGDGPFFKCGLYISGSSVIGTREIECRV